MGAGFGRVGAPVPVPSPVVHRLSADIEPIIGSGEDEPHALPAIGGASWHRIYLESVLGLIPLIVVRFFTGEARSVQRDHLSPRAPG